MSDKLAISSIAAEDVSHLLGILTATPMAG
jgi:hypothetical protein